MSDYFDNVNINDVMQETSVPSGAEVQPESPSGQPQSTSYYEYVANGKTIKEDLDTILKRASQGYNYAQHMNEFSSKEKAFQDRSRQLEATESKWKPYVDYATQNPQWADFVRQSYEQRYMSQQPQQDLTSTNFDGSSAQGFPKEILNEINDLKEFKNSVIEERRLRQVAEEDAHLHTQIEDVKKQYGDFDFSVTALSFQE